MTDLEKQSKLASSAVFQNRVRAAISQIALNAASTYQTKGTSASASEVARARYGQLLMSGMLEDNLMNLCRLIAANATVNAASSPTAGDTAVMSCTATDAQIQSATQAAFDALALPVTAPSSTSTPGTTSTASSVTAGVNLPTGS